MWLSDLSVKRPVFATVIALLLVAFGALAFNELAVREYPDISAPVISVSVGYPGASAEVVESRITQILEREVSGIEGAKAITSSSLDGLSTISVEFSLDRNIDEAARLNSTEMDARPSRLLEVMDLAPSMPLTSRSSIWVMRLSTTSADAPG